MADDLCANEGRRLWIPARTSLGRTTGIKKAGRARRFRRSMPPWKARYPGGAEHSTRAEELLLQLLLLGFLGLLRLLRLLRFLSHSILSGFNGLKRDTRGMLGGGPSLAKSSKLNSADSQRTAPHCHADVMALSTDVMGFDALFGENSPACGSECVSGVSPMRRNRLNPALQIFINSKPRRRFSGSIESPLSRTAASYR